MIEYALIALVAAVVLFELIEHVILPLIGYVFSRNRQPVSGMEGMIGKVAKVRRWHSDSGQVFVDGELWQAVCATPLLQGEKVVITAVDGLTLKVKPHEEPASTN